MNKKKTLFYLFDFIVFAVLIALDQFSKFLAVKNLKDHSDYIIFSNVFQLHYLENRGAAFGMLKNQKIFFVFVAIVIVTVIIYIIAKLPLTKHYQLGNWLLVVIAGGAVGNMIDRISYNYVVDFFYFSLINFPVFNVADIYVTVGTAILILSILFYYKEEDFECLKFEMVKNRKRTPNAKE